MERTNKIILVTGATGRQGSVTTRYLLAGGWKVRALTRDASAPAALELSQRGAEVVQGDTNDRSSLDAAMQGVYGVFNVQPPLGYDDDLRQGKNVAEAALAACVQHFVYTSVGGAQGQAAYRKLSKWEIEQLIGALGLPATILRPAWYMDNMIGPRFGVPHGQLSTAIKPDVVVPLIAVDDIGAFVALAFDRPDEYLGKTIEIAGDALTMPQIAAAISRVLGRSIPYVQISIETVRQQNADVALVYDFVNEGSLQVDISALRHLHPGLLDFDTWLRKTGKATLGAWEQSNARDML
ncbi:MAG: NmrA/HSCARG family protein [Ktedonobacteraceae bacterium]|nr:NmrA/HSCARG family protein [Ktedonobacteraceae bacterium]